MARSFFHAQRCGLQEKMKDTVVRLIPIEIPAVVFFPKTSSPILYGVLDGVHRICIISDNRPGDHSPA